MLQKYWEQLNRTVSRKYSIKFRTRRTRGNFVFKYKRVSSKKMVKKTKTTRLLRLVQFSLVFSGLTNSPPLSTILNLVGINVQKFCEDFNREMSMFLDSAIPIRLHVYIMRNLTYEYFIDVNYLSLLKTLNFAHYFNNNVGLYALNTVRGFRQRVFESSFLKRIFFNTDLFLLSEFVYKMQFFVHVFNYNTNKSFSFWHKNSLNILNYENVVYRLISNLKSLNLRLLQVKIKTVK